MKKQRIEIYNATDLLSIMEEMVEEYIEELFRLEWSRQKIKPFKERYIRRLEKIFKEKYPFVDFELSLIYRVNYL